MNRKKRRAARKTEKFGPIPGAELGSDSQIEQMLAAAYGHHQAGQFAEAERRYRRILAIDPRHVTSLHLLGVLSHQLGRNNSGLDLIEQAIALDDRNPDIHCNLARMLAAAGRGDEAIVHYAEAGRLRPHDATASFELGNLLAGQGRFAEAASHYRRALEADPNYAQALTNLGNALATLGQSEEAAGAWQRALAADPNNPAPHLNLGIAYRQQGRLDEAVTHLQSALALRPDSVEAINNLARALLAGGQASQALAVARRAIAINPTGETKAVIVDCLRHIQFTADEPEVRAIVLRALTEHWARLDKMIGPAAALAKRNPVVAACVSKIAQAWPTQLVGDELWSPSQRAAICGDPLLRALLETAPVCDLDLERFLTAARSAVLSEARAATLASSPDETELAFCCALARQCFINEYIFTFSAGEIEATRALKQSLLAALEDGEDIPPLWLAAIAAYIPLHSLPDAASLMTRPWPPAMQNLLIQQVQEPLQEVADHASIPALTVIEDTVSCAVRQQYEENPYPRWIRMPPSRTFDSFDSYLRGVLPWSDFRYQGRGERCDILVAGCGTGHHAIDVALRSKDARVLAIDLSLASLAYARRKTRELGLTNIYYAQADILRTGPIGRTFDVIESGGVLHQLDDPMEGWHALLALLRPGGIMYLGLYSELARQSVVAVRSFIAARGYQRTADDIRRFRQDMVTADHGLPLGNLLTSPDFFNASGCRDLFFNTQEHRLTLPQIKSFLDENNLKFLGFQLDAQLLQQFRRQFPAAEALTDLDCWHVFETNNPNAFSAMYHFWIQKPQ
jgi:tetratricopeptide (TPR) repeat protein/SAM-dependent methyltransferase